MHSLRLFCDSKCKLWDHLWKTQAEMEHSCTRPQWRPKGRPCVIFDTYPTHNYAGKKSGLKQQSSQGSQLLEVGKKMVCVLQIFVFSKGRWVLLIILLKLFKFKFWFKTCKFFSKLYRWYRVNRWSHSHYPCNSPIKPNKSCSFCRFCLFFLTIMTSAESVVRFYFIITIFSHLHQSPWATTGKKPTPRTWWTVDQGRI